MTAVTGIEIWSKAAILRARICDDAAVVTNLRLALDVAAVRDEPAGVGIYAASLARGLSRIAPERLTMIGARDEARMLEAARARTRSVRFDAPRLPSSLAPNYNAWLQTYADRDARRTGANLVHYTNAAAPILGSLPYVLTVHDLSVIRLPHFHPFMRVATIPVTLVAVARARAIVVPSDWVKGELVRGLRVSPRRVVVIEHTASDMPVKLVDPDAVAARFGVSPYRYLLSVGTIEPRKNVLRLVAAFEKLAAEDAELRLVLAGAPGWRRAAIERRIAASRYANRIVLTGYVSNDDAAALTSRAAVFCYVSTYEGFGLPVIESLALGAPVVTSNRTATPQAAGGAAVLVDPFDVADIARGIREAMALRVELSAAGPARVAGRSWDDVAREHLAVYEWAHARD
jgi:glycosyltransferase involved in cell wall biosynthesis